MKTYIRFGCPMLLLSLLAARPARSASFVEATNFISFDDAERGTYLYANSAFKIDDKTKFVPELLTLFTYREGGENKFSTTHGYLRLTLSRKDVAELGSWKLGLTGRYSPPTTTKAQQAGSFGALFGRMDLSRDSGPWSFLVREGIGAHLVRNGYQVNVPIADAKGNQLLFNNLDVLVSYALTSKLTVSTYFLSINTLVGPSSLGRQGTSWANELWQEHEIRYIEKEWGNLEFALSLFHISDYSPGADFKFLSSTASANFKIAKTF